MRHRKRLRAGANRIGGFPDPEPYGSQCERALIPLQHAILGFLVGLSLISAVSMTYQALGAENEDLNKGIDPNKNCLGENMFIRNGTCWARMISNPQEFVSHEMHLMCHKADGTVEIRINKYALVDIIHVTQGKKLQHPRMEVIQGEEELLWETTRDDGLETNDCPLSGRSGHGSW
jgi:hypothetical protein